MQDNVEHIRVGRWALLRKRGCNAYRLPFRSDLPTPAIRSSGMTHDYRRHHINIT